ncbi:hypothetical protein [Nocardia sp. NPDC019395]|uniref:hypothetical protein n=1 Tax=Nocardia sp. NPDC019395 TaxID=3154686 RepID=UPI0033CC1F87
MTGTGEQGRPTPYPFGVDETTRKLLGPAGLADLAANLWPHECQTCGQHFAGTRPAVYVRAGDPAIATAGLHHPDCQPARWDNERSSAPPSERARPLNFVLRTFQLPTVTELGGPETWRPFLLVNPGLEQVFLGKQGGQWRVATTSYYTQFGLQASDGLMKVSGSVPDGADDARTVADQQLRDRRLRQMHLNQERRRDQGRGRDR